MNKTKNETAALALATAVRDFLSDGTAFEWQKVVADSLEIAQVDRKRFDKVVSCALDSGLLVHRKTSAGVTRLFPGPQLAKGKPEKKPKPDPAAPSKLEKQAAADSKRTAPTRPYPELAKCEKCGWQATLCLHCNEPCFDDDLYTDSKGSWMCGSCNDLTYAESWGGIKRWKREDQN